MFGEYDPIIDVSGAIAPLATGSYVYCFGVFVVCCVMSSL